MTYSKAIFVTGATGNQGGAVLRHLSQQGFFVKALTRNIHSEKAQALQNKNVNLVTGDLNNPETYRHHLKDIHGIFSVQSVDKGVNKEISQGITLATLAKEYDVRHFLYSSSLGADLHTGIRHWESKWKIENHIRRLGLPFTIIRPACLFENFLLPQVKSRILKGVLPSPVNKNVIQHFISSNDIGKISAAIFSDPASHTGRTISIASEKMDLQQVAGIFSQTLGREIKYQKLPPFITRLAMGRHLYKMFKWINEKSSFEKEDIDSTRTKFPGLLSLETWIKMNFPTKASI